MCSRVFLGKEIVDGGRSANQMIRLDVPILSDHCLSSADYSQPDRYIRILESFSLTRQDWKKLKDTVAISFLDGHGYNVTFSQDLLGRCRYRLHCRGSSRHRHL